MNKIPSQPRILRAAQAPSYLGMCRDVFNRTVRPHVREFPIGKQRVGFDRIELDVWADEYITNHSIDKPIPVLLAPRKKCNWDTDRSAGFASNHSASIKHNTDTKNEFEKALAMVMGKSRTRHKTPTSTDADLIERSPGRKIHGIPRED